MYRFVCVSLLLLTLLVLPMGQACPRSCNCYQANEVHCTFRSLLTIPPGLPVHTRRINLGFNSISRIHDSSLVGLRKVELLMLHSNDLRYLPDNAFRDMKSLQILKLSYNKLREISSSLTFSGLTSLLRLYLDHNHLQHIHPRALLQLPSLRLLRLQGNRLHQLHPHTLCTLSLLNTYYFSTLRHVDLSNNSLTTLPRETLATAPLLESLVLQANPWSCDCRMNWFLSWSLSHPGLMKCPSGAQCPTCGSPNSLQGQGLLEQTDLLCTSPIISSPGRDTSLEADISEIQSSESFRESMGTASLGLSDHQGHSVDLTCNISQASDSQDITPPPDLSPSSPTPFPLALSVSLDCPVDRESYENLWRILAYYSETAVRLEREIMLSKAPTLAYRYRQAAETDGYYHTGVRASVKTRPQWLLQSAISIQLNRAQSNGRKVQLIYSTRVSTHRDPTSTPYSQPWVMISTNHTTTALAAAAGSKVELPCPLLSSGTPKVMWTLPDGSKLTSTSNNLDGRLSVSNSALLLHKAQLSDSGVYYCVARAGRDVDVLPLRLAVAESSVPHSEEQVGPAITGTVGEHISLSCKVTGSPVPLVNWMLPDGTIVRPGIAVSGGLTLQSNGSLSLLKPSQRDAGHYRCIAVNQYGSDSLSRQLELHSPHIPPLRASFPRGPQSAAGRSTKIRAPLQHEVEEGSGAEVVEEDRPLPGRGRRPRPLQPSPNRRYPVGNPRRRGPMREVPMRRGGPASATDQRRNRFEGRHRVTPNKQRIDPKKWADILAKIRQKTLTNNGRSVAGGKPTDKPEGRDQDTRRREEDRGTTEVAETEGSSVDDTDLQEEELQPIHPVLTDTQTHTEAKPDTETEITKGTGRSTDTPTDTENETETRVQTETVTNPETWKEVVTSKPEPATNEIAPEKAETEEPKASPNPSRIVPQKPRQGPFPNLPPNSRAQSPWNSRRRIGQRRRLINRPRGRPLTPPRTLPEPVTPTSQTVTLDTTRQPNDMLLQSVTTTSPAIPVTESDHIRTGVPHIPQTLPVSSTSESASPSVTPPPTSLTSLFPSRIKTHIDVMTHSAIAPDSAEPTLLSTPTPVPTQSDAIIAQTREPDTNGKTHTHGTQTHSETHTSQGKHVDRAPSKHNEELEKNLLLVPYVPQSSTSSSPTLSSIASSSDTSAAPSTTTTTAQITTTTFKSTHSDNFAGSTSSVSTAMIKEETHPTTTTSPIMSTKMFIPTFIERRSSTTTLTPTTSSTTQIPSSTAPTTISSESPSTILSTTSATRTRISFKASTTTPNPTTTTTTTTTTTVSTTSARATISLETSPTTTVTTTPRAPSTTTTAIASTVAAVSSREGSNVGQVDPRGRPVSGSPNQSRPPTDWKNPGANSIPDSHSSRPRWPPSPPLPAAPGAPVARSRPRIADPHIRTVSFPAESTARLDCEAQGEPKPSITWTKVATGVVMSIHSKAQRFEVLPNGTLVIQNVQLQDRGTYICSAQSFMGRDRLLATLEVWTRPPRMQLATYRETTIHQGGELLLQCQADGVPTPLLSWVLPDRSALTSSSSSNSRMSMDANGTLHIPVTLPSDRGVYRCVASNSAGAASASVRVHVSSLPPVMQQPREEHLLLSPGRPVYAHCSARGAPPPMLRWRIPDGTLVRPSQFLHGNLFVLPNGTLHIRKVGPKDSGTYECTASNAVGTNKRTVKVEIEGERGQGGAINERAKAFATERPSFSSRLNNDRTLSNPSRPSDPDSSPPSPQGALPLNPGSSRSSSYPHHSNSAISSPKINRTVTAPPTQLTNINKTEPSPLSPPSAGPTHNTPASSGVVNNTRVISSPLPDRGRAPSVLQPSPLSPFSKARIVSTSPSITNVHYGKGLQLHCSVTGNPAPIIIWRTPNRKLVDMHFSFDRRLKVHPNGTLSVQAVTEKDAGDYLCVARNKVADDYRLLRVSVATKPAKIEPKQPLNHMVLFGKPLKVDCQASGLPDPAVRWSLPDGTTVNSVLQGEDRAGRARRLTVFDNGTLLVPAVGAGEEGEYTCYAENQGGQDSMKVKVKVMMTSPPTFSDTRSYRVLKVRQGQTATMPCQASGDPPPTVTWFSPANRVIPRSFGSGFYSERVVVVSGGTLEVRLAQKIDTGNYTCRASNSAGGRSLMVGLEVETPNYGLSRQVGGQSWTNNGHSGRSGDNIINGRIIQSGITNGDTSKLGRNNDSNNGYSDGNTRIKNVLSYAGVNTATSGFNPAPRSDSQNGFNRPVTGITSEVGSTVIGAGSKLDSSGINRNGPGISASNTLSTVRVGGETNPGTNNNEVITGKANNNAYPNSNGGVISGNSRDAGVVSSAVFNHGAGAGTLRGNGLSGNTDVRGTSDNSRGSAGLSSTGKAAINADSKNSTSTAVGAVKRQVMKGQTVLLPCPSHGSPPPRLAWLLPGNGVLPAPYYGSRLTVHRNGSLELRGVRMSDSGTLICVVRSERGETRVQVELEVWEAPNRSEGASLESARSVPSKPEQPERIPQRVQATQPPVHRGPSFPVAPRPVGPPPPISEPVVSTKASSLVSIVNGETLHLPCAASQTRAHAQGSLIWTMPSGKVLTRGESGDSGRYQVHQDGTLTVHQASVYDRGTYTCRSTSLDSASVSVVTVPVIVIAYPPRITKGPSPVTYTRPGAAVELPCLTIATPRATVTWETPDLSQLRVMGQARIYGNRYLSPQGSLVIQNPTSRDTGFYRCTAKNVIGVDSKSTYLHVI